MANDELDVVIDDLVGHRHGLFRIAGIVVANALQLRAVHPAGLVDLLDGHFGPDELHVPYCATGPVTGPANPMRIVSAARL